MSNTRSCNKGKAQSTQKFMDRQLFINGENSKYLGDELNAGQAPVMTNRWRLFLTPNNIELETAFRREQRPRFMRAHG
jgi:hypothetical protein